MSRLALIFDLDDTLIASFDGYVHMHQRVATHLGWRVPTRREFVDYGASWEATLAALWPERDLSSFFAHYDQIADDYVYPAIAGALAMLQAVHARGHRLFVVSKRSRTRIFSRMAAAGIAADLFDGVFAAEDQPANKPDPRCFEPVWQRLGGRKPALYVGDRREDWQAADAAGLPFVAVKTGPESEFGYFDDKFAWQPAAVLAEVGELAAWLVQADAREKLEKRRP